MLFEVMLLESKQRNSVLFDLLPIYFLRDEVHRFELYDITVMNALTLQRILARDKRLYHCCDTVGQLWGRWHIWRAPTSTDVLYMTTQQIGVKFQSFSTLSFVSRLVVHCFERDKCPNPVCCISGECGDH